MRQYWLRSRLYLLVALSICNLLRDLYEWSRNKLSRLIRLQLGLLSYTHGLYPMVNSLGFLISNSGCEWAQKSNAKILQTKRDRKDSSWFESMYHLYSYILRCWNIYRRRQLNLREMIGMGLFGGSWLSSLEHFRSFFVDSKLIRMQEGIIGRID